MNLTKSAHCGHKIQTLNQEIYKKRKKVSGNRRMLIKTNNIFVKHGYKDYLCCR